MKRFLPYAKAVVAVAGAVLASVETGLASGSTPSQVGILATQGLLTALAVYLVPNAPKSK